MGVACRAPASLRGRLVLQLKAKGSEKGDHQCSKRLAIVKPLNVGCFIGEIDGAGTVVSCLCGCCNPGGPLRASGRGSGCNTMRETHVEISGQSCEPQGMITRIDDMGKVNLQRRHNFGTFFGPG
jgi:hypothetical protein